MKFSTILFLTVTTLSTHAFARASKLHCQASFDQYEESYALDIKGQYIGGWIKDIVVIATDKTEQTVGRAADLNRDQNYAPRKYVGHDRFDLSKLTDTKDFSRFNPWDQCALHLLLPADENMTAQFKTPILIHCDQSGGKMMASCELK